MDYMIKISLYQWGNFRLFNNSVGRIIETETKGMLTRQTGWGMGAKGGGKYSQ